MDFSLRTKLFKTLFLLAERAKDSLISYHRMYPIDIFWVSSFTKIMHGSKLVHKKCCQLTLENEESKKELQKHYMTRDMEKPLINKEKSWENL